MSKYLRHKTDGRIYIYTELLAQHVDLEPYDPPQTQDAAGSDDKPKRARRGKGDELVPDDADLGV